MPDTQKNPWRLSNKLYAGLKGIETAGISKRSVLRAALVLLAISLIAPGVWLVFAVALALAALGDITLLVFLIVTMAILGIVIFIALVSTISQAW
jgi:hypothetical protein